MRRPLRRPLRHFLILLAALGLPLLLGAAALLYVLDERGIAPRALGPYIERRSSGHNWLIEHTGRWVAATLTRLDRGEPWNGPLPSTGAGVQPAAATGVAGTLVASSDELRKAMAGAQPGDTITILPGSYRFEGAAILARQAGSGAAPITVRAAAPGSVLLEFALVEGIKVTGPYWRFENLKIRGLCGSHSDCEHAFHVSGNAHHFIARNNDVADFNAHFKINGEGGQFPDAGLIEHNTLHNTSVRHTANPVVPIDLVAASGWTIRANLISDFVKAEGNQVSFGAFAKGGGGANVFEANVVVCEGLLRPTGGQRVGLSLGGGATAPQYCRDSRCITEQSGSTIAANLVSSCSDVGIYLNSAADSRIIHNSVIDTGGIDVRFPASSAVVAGNLVDGAIRSRNGGLLWQDDNRATPIAALYLGWHPERALFQAPGELDFRWSGAAPRRAALPAPVPPDLCGSARPAAPAYGAFEDFSVCRRGAVGR